MATSPHASPQVISARSQAGPSARGAALAATGLVSIAALLGLASMAMEAASSTSDGPGAGVFAAEVLAVAPVFVVAVLAILTVLARPASAGALTAGFGAISAGLAVLDAGLLASPIDANRLELLRPTTAEALTPGLGAYVVLAAHALAALAGVFGLVAISRASYDDGYGISSRTDFTGRASAVRIGGALSVVAVLAAIAAAAAMFAVPYVSTDSIVLIRAVVESPWTTAVGSGVLACAAVIVVSAALASISPTVAAGSLLGAGLGIAGVFGARVIAGESSGPNIGVSAGSWIGAVAGVALIVVALVALPASAIRDRASAGGPVTRGELDGSAHFMRWHALAGTTGVLAGVLVGASAFLPVLDVPAGLSEPDVLATRVALVAGFVLVVVSIPLFFSLFAAVVRPAVGVLAVAAVSASAGVLQAVVLATDIDGVGLGVGGAAAAVGAVLAMACAGAVLLAGSAERDDVDTSDVRSNRTVGAVALVGGVVTALSFALPLYTGTDVSAPSLLGVPWGAEGWGWDAWGQAASASTILLAALVASRSRPARGAALLVGCVIATIVHLLGWPLTIGRSVDASVGAGLLVGVLGAVILAVAALLSANSARK
ncbi:hypothetical protein [Rhodococcoides fascians]|uniref:hypothetical protein n=1 Tax=Rhodococcoides fascians TaxID=1828 RepID=UPI001FC926CE|nr:hypothetical protein [Rhodococcus fascians]